MNQKKIIFFLMALTLPACQDPNPAASGDETPPPVALLRDLPAPDEAPPSCAIHEELLDDDGRLACPEGASWVNSYGDEECRADPREPVLMGPSIHDAERVLPYHEEERPVTWWISDAHAYFCDEAGQFVSYVSDLRGGCWVRCWGGLDEEGRCAFCSGALTCVACEGL